jgi:hypothetical protein
MVQSPADYKALGLKICPYDATHVIKNKRFSRHLVKCAKNNANAKNFTSCDYNYSHKIKRGEGSEHYKHCSERQNYERWLEDGKDVKKGCTSLPIYEDAVIEGENWDDELELVSSRYHGFIPDIKKQN